MLGPKPSLLLVARNLGKPTCHRTPSQASWPASLRVPSLSGKAGEKLCPAFRLCVGVRTQDLQEVGRREPTSGVCGALGRRHRVSAQSQSLGATPHQAIVGADGAGLRVWPEVPGSLTEGKLGRVSGEISRLSVTGSSRSGCLRRDAGSLSAGPRLALGMTTYGWT